MEKNNKKGGWHEDTDPSCINEKGKPVARKHHEVSIREKLRGVLRIPLTAPLKHEDKDEDEDHAEEIVEEVQESRKKSAIAMDESRNAKKIGDKEDAEDLVDWIKDPRKSDIEGVGDKQPKPKLVKSGDFKGALKVEESKLYT